MYSKGTTLKIDFGLFYHYGISDGNGGVIHCSKKRLEVAHESEIDFSEGREILVSDITSNTPRDALDKAKKFLGMPYDLFSSNCEHFARLCHGLEKESTQIQKYLLVGVASGVALKNDNLVIKAASSAAGIAALFTPREKSPLMNSAISALIAAALVFALS